MIITIISPILQLRRGLLEKISYLSQTTWLIREGLMGFEPTHLDLSCCSIYGFSTLLSGIQKSISLPYRENGVKPLSAS